MHALRVAISRIIGAGWSSRAGAASGRPYRENPGRRREQRRRRFQISNGSVDIVRIYDSDGTWRILDRVTWRQIGHIFAGVTRAGAASGRPYGKNTGRRRERRRWKFQISDLRLRERRRTGKILRLRRKMRGMRDGVGLRGIFGVAWESQKRRLAACATGWRVFWARRTSRGREP